MITEFEIIDTAIKIGLGALISSIATYIVTHKNHLHEVRKNIASDKRQLLIEIVNLESEYSHLRNEAIISIWHKKRSKGEGVSIQEEMTTIWSAGSKLKKAISGAYLINNNELSSALKELHENLNKLQRYLYSMQLSCELDFVEENTSNSKILQDKLHNEYGHALKAIYS